MVDFLEDYEIRLDLKQAELYQIDRALAGGSIILRAKPQLNENAQLDVIGYLLFVQIFFLR